LKALPFCDLWQSLRRKINHHFDPFFNMAALYSLEVVSLITDSYPGYNGAVVDGRDHETVNHHAKEYARYENGFCITTKGIESAFSLLKRGIIGSWHKVSAKHLQAYLDEMTWRFDNRNNPYLFRDTMMKLIEAPVLEYKRLTSAA
jgi:hypothetical protein